MVLAIGLACLAAAPPAVGAEPGADAPPWLLTAPTLPTAPSGDAPALSEPIDPETYRVGPGDEFAFRTSDLLDPKTLRVGPTGAILLPDVGPLAVTGLTLREVETRAREALRPYVKGRGFVLSLSRPRRFRIVVAGDVERPGAVLVQAPVRASDAIAAAGGVGSGGARRGIVVRRGTDSLRADLVLFERTGDRAANPLVFETDVIVVPAAGPRVLVQGAVAHPAFYDLAPGDRARTLIAVAGGLLPRAARAAVRVSREDRPGHREEWAVLLDGSDGDDPPLAAGDQVFVPEEAHWGEGAHVDVLGEVSLPGPYAIVDGEDRLEGLLSRAGGFTAWADTNAIRVERRSDAASRDSAFLRLARDQEALIPAGERDYVAVVARERAALSWGGAERGSSSAPRYIRLLDGDRIVVPRRSLTVMVQGEVKAPGHLSYEAGRKLDDYVKAAGGYTGRANRGRVRVTLAATGRLVTANEAGELMPGDVVWVPAKEPRSTWGIVRDVLTTASQIATVYLVVREATK